MGSGPLYNSGGRYNPVIDSWLATSTANAPSPRFLTTAVWTGTEMIIWGGNDFGISLLYTGGRYNPSTNIWTPTSVTGRIPEGRFGHTAVWTGTEMIVWGGEDEMNTLNSGARYDPSANSWVLTSTGAGVPEARTWHSAVWADNQMIVWGGITHMNDVTNTGGKYNPATNTWTATSTSGAPEGREHHTAVWTGTEMIVWGGENNEPSGTEAYRISTNCAARPSIPNINWAGASNRLNIPVGPVVYDTGGRYNPSTNSWAETSLTNVPKARTDHTAVWTGNEMIVWGGDDGCNPSNSGGKYYP
jgi:N-acetylneuraminic acid mutarotase